MPNVMFSFPEMLTTCCGSLTVPDNVSDYKAEEYPHWRVFENIHLGVPMSMSQIERNANIISKIPDNKIRQVTHKELIDLGCDLEPVSYVD